MAFTADLNPKGGKSMDLLDLVKMEAYLGQKGAGKEPKSAKTTATPAADAILAKPVPNNMIKSNADDMGVEFKFNNSQNDNMA